MTNCVCLPVLRVRQVWWVYWLMRHRGVLRRDPVLLCARQCVWSHCSRTANIMDAGSSACISRMARWRGVVGDACLLLPMCARCFEGVGYGLGCGEGMLSTCRCGARERALSVQTHGSRRYPRWVDVLHDCACFAEEHRVVPFWLSTCSWRVRMRGKVFGVTTCGPGGH